MSIYLKTCEECGKKYDMLSCPYCNEKKYGEIKKGEEGDNEMGK